MLKIMIPWQFFWFMTSELRWFNLGWWISYSDKSCSCIYRFFEKLSSIQDQPHVSSSIRLEMALESRWRVDSHFFQTKSFWNAPCINQTKSTAQLIHLLSWYSYKKIAIQVLSKTTFKSTLASVEAEIFRFFMLQMTRNTLYKKLK